MTRGPWKMVTDSSEVKPGDSLRWSDIPGSLAIVLGPGGPCPCGRVGVPTFALSDDPVEWPWSEDGNCLWCDIERGVLYRLVIDDDTAADETTVTRRRELVK